MRQGAVEIRLAGTSHGITAIVLARDGDGAQTIRNALEPDRPGSISARVDARSYASGSPVCYDAGGEDRSAKVVGPRDCASGLRTAGHPSRTIGGSHGSSVARTSPTAPG